MTEGIDIRYDLDEDLPDIMGDAKQITQMLKELVDNASEAIGDETGFLTLRTGRTEQTGDDADNLHIGTQSLVGHYAFVEVEDSGPGMDAQTKARIFDPFFSTRFLGRGLGLSVVDGIVRAHHGVICVRSAPGRGTSVRLLFPFRQAPPEVASVAADPTPAGNTILVVDDEVSIRRLAKRVLEMQGFRVLLASNGAEGVDRLRQSSAEILAVLLDTTMPRMGSTEAFVLMRQFRPDVPILLSSGYSEERATGSLGTQELVSFIQKPYSPRDLAKKLRSLLQQRE